MEYLIIAGVAYAVLCVGAVYLMFRQDKKYLDVIEEGNEDE